MKLNQINESLYRMGETSQVLTEANSPKSVLAQRADALQKIAKITADRLNRLNVMDNLDKVKDYAKMLDWVSKLGKQCVELSKKNYDEKELATEIKKIDGYLKQLADSIKQDKISL